MWLSDEFGNLVNEEKMKFFVIPGKENSTIKKYLLLKKNWLRSYITTNMKEISKQKINLIKISMRYWTTNSMVRQCKMLGKSWT